MTEKKYPPISVDDVRSWLPPVGQTFKVSDISWRANWDGRRLRTPMKVLERNGVIRCANPIRGYSTHKRYEVMK